MTSDVAVDRQPTRCKYCPAMVFWARYEASGKLSPIDFEPDDDKGNVVIVGVGAAGEPLVSALRQTDVGLFEERRLFVDHHATCPNPPRRKGRK